MGSKIPPLDTIPSQFSLPPRLAYHFLKISLINILVAESGGSGQSLPKPPANGHDPEPVPSTFHPSALQLSSYHMSFVLRVLSQNSIYVLSLRTQPSYPQPIHYGYSNRRTVWPKPPCAYHHLLTSTYTPHMH